MRPLDQWNSYMIQVWARSSRFKGYNQWILLSYAAYLKGEEPEDDSWVLDFGEWASVYRTWLAIQAEYRNEIQRRQADAPSLAGLIHVSP